MNAEMRKLSSILMPPKGWRGSLFYDALINTPPASISFADRLFNIIDQISPITGI